MKCCQEHILSAALLSECPGHKIRRVLGSSCCIYDLLKETQPEVQNQNPLHYCNISRGVVLSAFAGNSTHILVNARDPMESTNEVRQLQDHFKYVNISHIQLLMVPKSAQRIPV